MKIYRNIITLLALVAAAACTKSENGPVPDKEVSYRVADVKLRTKAGEVSFLGEFADPSDAAFSSVAYLHGQGVAGVQDFYNGVETISWDGSDRWAPSATYYWPKGAESYVNFISWYDKNGTPDLASISETSLSWTGRNIAADENIMVADLAWRCKANASTYHIDDPSVVGVPTLFRHLLSRVAFTGKVTKTSDAGTTWAVTIRNFTVKNVLSTGSLVLSNADPSTTQTVEWKAQDGVSAPSWTGSTPANVSGINNVTLGTSDTVLLPMRSFLPQSASAISINFDYTIRTTYSANHYLEESKNSGDILLSSFIGTNASWDMNKMITYKLTFNPEAEIIEIDPYSTSWTTMPAQTISIEE